MVKINLAKILMSMLGTITHNGCHIIIIYKTNLVVVVDDNDDENSHLLTNVLGNKIDKNYFPTF
jgi:hypothetical protein